MDVLGDIIEFDWDEGNEGKNWISHKISSKEAEDPFYDKQKLILDDIKHSDDEERFILIGKTKQAKMLFIVFTVRAEKIRVISARKADRKEVDFYEKAINITKI